MTGNNEISSEKLRVNYGNSVISVPGAVREKWKGARKQDILILLELLAVPDASPENLAERCETDVSAVESALAFWRGAGILSFEGEGDEPARESRTPAKPQKPPKELESVPTYTTEEVAAITEKAPGIRNMIDECERLLGRMFGQTDCMKMVSVLEYFGLDPEYMLLACAHCAGIGQKSVGYVTKTVSSLCSRGITTVEALNDYLFAIEKSEELETQIRKMFGMNMTRELTERERGFLSEWSDKFGYGIEIIRKAYDITVDTTGSPAISYANAILNSWYTNDLKTEEQIDAYLAAEKNRKKQADGTRSFTSEDFFAAALARSYGSAENAPAVEKVKAPEKRNYGVSGRK